jgi:hypothetical protein
LIDPSILFYHKFRNRASHKLYVINHAYAKGGERIDVFKVTIGGKDGKVSKHLIQTDINPSHI